MNLDYGPQSVSLQIADDGCGFAVGDHAGPREGHFGLLGISERVQRIGGKLAINSNAGSGTVIRVEVPTETVLEIQWSSVGDANGELIDEK
jgi:signal transduction histidine kinase